MMIMLIKTNSLKKELSEFITNLRSHFSEEEQIVFPLALKADSTMIVYYNKQIEC